MFVAKTILTILMCTSLFACGKAANSSAPKIIGGRPAKPGEYPETVSIMRGNESICSGVVIAKRTVLTAAHCVEDVDPSTLKIYSGEDVANATDQTQFDIAEIAIHPQFWQGYLSGNDLATITTVADLPVEPASLVLPEDLTQLPPKSVLIVGYGVTNNDRSQSTFGIKNWARADIQGFFGDELYTGNHMSDTCSGDSGGPAFLETRGKLRKLFAVTSRGPTPCAQDLDPGIMTQVQAGICWFSKTVDPHNLSWSRACKKQQEGERLDLSAETLQNAKELNLANRNLRDISILSKTRSLVSVNLSANQIFDASVLLNIATLKKVDLRNNRIADARLFQKLKDRGITVLGVYSQEHLAGKSEFLRIANLGFGAGVENRMTTLALRGILTIGNNERKSRDLMLRRVIGLNSRGVQSLAPLAYLENAESVLLSGNPLVKDLSPLLTLPALKYLDIRGTGVLLEDPTQKKILDDLRCGGVQVLQGNPQ